MKNTTEKSFTEFMKLLLEITEQNLRFSQGKHAQTPKNLSKYKEEMLKISECINSFDFVANKNLCSNLLE